MNLILTVFWLIAAAAFCAWIYVAFGPDKAGEFASAYILEKSLSIDNLFVFSLIFASFNFPPKIQRKLLNWGIIGAFVFRGILIAAGAGLVSACHSVIYLLGAFLLYTAFKVFTNKEGNAGPDTGLRYKLRGLNPYLACILMVEASDLIFALDSIPASFAVTQDAFIIYTANLFAILGLRSLYFVLADLLDRFDNLKYGIAVVLAFIGLKIMVSGFIEIPIWVSLAVITTVLGTSMLVKGVKHAD